MKGDVAQSSEVMSLAGGEGGSAAVYGLDSKPAEGAQPAEGTLPRKAIKPLAPQALKAKRSKKNEHITR